MTPSKMTIQQLAQAALPLLREYQDRILMFYCEDPKGTAAGSDIAIDAIEEVLTLLKSDAK